MIRNGYYVPKEMYENLTHIEYETGEIKGKASIGICVGNRTGGKTVGHGIQMIKNYVEHGERCALLTRTKRQIDEGYLEKWWNKILNIEDDENVIPDFVNNHEIGFTKDEVTVDGDIFCYCIPISLSQDVKNTGSFKNCTHIYMDEAFQAGESHLWINGREAMSRIFEIWQTVARGRDEAVNTTNLIFIANSSERENWIFTDLRINDFVRKDTKFTTQKGICVEFVMNKTAAKKVETSIMGEVMRNSISGRKYYESAQNNEFTDNDAFVRKKGLDFRDLRIQLVINGAYIGIFKNENESEYHAAKIEKDKRSSIITNNVRYVDEDVKFEINGAWEMGLRDIFKNGAITFQNQESKNLFLEYVRL